MQRVAEVVQRMRAIEARIGSSTPSGGFARSLAAATHVPGNTPLNTMSSQGSTLAWPSTMTLGQMLGRPVGELTTATSPPAALGTASPAAGGLLHRPVAGPITSGFGMRTHPITGERKLHAGIDLAAPTGTPIGAAAAGIVTFAGVRGGYGNLVVIEHADGTETRYAHQATMAVRAGDRVTTGQVIGTVGSTGLSTGPHLHLELRRNGRPVDPAPLLRPR